MNLRIYQVDAFSNNVFSGNPAAVCPLEKWLDDSVMQNIAQENNLSETAFFAPEGDGYRIRWFTPLAEVDLCGHATLASAFVFFNFINKTQSQVSFNSRSGILKVRRENDLIVLNFPTQAPKPCDTPKELIEGLGKAPIEFLRCEDYFAVFADEKDIQEMNPDFDKLRKLDLRGLIVTAKGTDVDFVSRFFAPRLGIDEDPVTGSSHCALTPYWSKKLGKKILRARQLSRRGGELHCVDLGERVEIAGAATLYMEGEIRV